jgi:hypothetical protein
VTDRDDAIAEKFASLLCDEDDPLCAARHEAAHAVVTCWQGFTIGPDGVSIGPGQPVCNVRSHRKRTWREEAMFSLAGSVAEQIAGKPDAVSSRDWLRMVLENIRAGWDRDHAHDDTAVLSAILDAQPSLTDDEVLAEFRALAAETEAILRRPELWESVERLAAELLARQRLDDCDVRELLHPDACCGALRS